MSLLPDITEIIPSTWTSADILSELSSHWNGTSTKFTRTLVGTNAIVIESITDVGIQHSLRATGSLNFAVELEPGNTLTDAGDTSTRPTGASSDNSGSLAQSLGTLSAGSKVWLWEWDDAWMLAGKSAAGTSWQYGIMCGRVWVPDCPDVDEPLGRDGLGILIGSLTVGSSNTNTMFLGSASTSPDTDYGVIHIGTNRWAHPTGSSSSSYSASDEQDNVVYTNYVRPFALQVGAVVRPSYSSNCGLGRFKYLWRTGATGSPLVRMDLNNSTELAWIRGGNAGSTSASNNTAIFPWRKSVTP